MQNDRSAKTLYRTTVYESKFHTTDFSTIQQTSVQLLIQSEHTEVIGMLDFEGMVAKRQISNLCVTHFSIWYQWHSQDWNLLQRVR